MRYNRPSRYGLYEYLGNEYHVIGKENSLSNVLIVADATSTCDLIENKRQVAERGTSKIFKGVWRCTVLRYPCVALKEMKEVDSNRFSALILMRSISDFAADKLAYQSIPIS